MSPCTGRRDQERRARCKVGREHDEHHHLHEEQRHLRRFLSLPDGAANVSVNIVYRRPVEVRVAERFGHVVEEVVGRRVL